jgi:hypothetical protein
MKSRFYSSGYEVVLIILISFFLLANIYLLFSLGSWKHIISIAILSTLLYLVLSKHRYLRIALKIWGILFMISGGLNILIPYIQDIIGDPDWITFFWGAAMVGIGSLVLYIVSEEMYLEEEVQEVPIWQEEQKENEHPGTPEV